MSVKNRRRTGKKAKPTLIKKLFESAFFRKSLFLFGWFVLFPSVILLSFVYFLYNYPLFNVRDILFSGDYKNVSIEKSIRERYIGRNIFKVDISSIRQSVLLKGKTIKDCVVTREMPSCITITVVPREPIAFISGLKKLPVDKEGVVLSLVAERRLPVIYGVNLLFLWPKVGEQIKDKNLREAINVITSLKANGFDLSNIEKIKAANPKDISFYFRNGVEVKLGQGDLSKKISRLKEALSSPEIDLGKIEYIDLRFGDVVISPK